LPPGQTGVMLPNDKRAIDGKARVPVTLFDWSLAGDDIGCFRCSWFGDVYCTIKLEGLPFVDAR